MITIDHLSADYRIAARAEARTQAARRLDHVSRTLLSEALEAVAQDFADADGPVIRIRRIRLKLWLDLARRSDGQIAHDWANLLARALHRQIIEAGPDEVRRYDNQASYLVAWVNDVLRGTAAGQWMYTEFEPFADLPRGQTIAAGLARYPQHVTRVLRALVGQGKMEAVIQKMTLRDVTALWTAWMGERPSVVPDINLPLLNRLSPDQSDILPMDPGGVNARARAGLRWLVALTFGQPDLRPQVAAPLAMQAAHLSVLVQSIPGFAQIWRARVVNMAEIRRMFATAPSRLETSLAWAQKLCEDTVHHPARVALLALVERHTTTPDRPKLSKAVPKTPERVATPFAGAGLLLTSIRAIDPENEWTAHDRLHLLSDLFTGAQKALARGDIGLRWITGVPLDHVLEDPSEGWEDRAPLALHRFRTSLRGMEASTTPYLTRQFFDQPGMVERTKEELRVRINVVPLKVLLQLGGALGEQGRLPWLEERVLRVEVGDG